MMVAGTFLILAAVSCALKTQEEFAAQHLR